MLGGCRNDRGRRNDRVGAEPTERKIKDDDIALFRGFPLLETVFYVKINPKREYEIFCQIFYGCLVCCAVWRRVLRGSNNTWKQFNRL